MQVNPVERAIELRKTLKKEDKILVADYSDTLQGKDTSKVIDIMPNVRTNEQVFRTKINVKEIDPLAHKKYGLDFFDVNEKTEEEIENFIKFHEFDFPLWFKHTEGFEMKRVCDYNLPFVFQVGGCNFHDGLSTGGCMYCFVDDESNNGIVGRGKAFLGVKDIVDSFLHASNKINEAYEEIGRELHIKVVRASGGEPTIVLDWIEQMWKELKERVPDAVGQLDSNLSTGRVVDKFEKDGIYEEGILKRLAKYPIKVLTAIKGVSDENIRENVQAHFSLDDQIYSLEKFVESGLDIFPHVYNPDPKELNAYLRNMDKRIQNFSLKLHIGSLHDRYGPTRKRLGDKIENYSAKWKENYEKSCELLNKYLLENYGTGYKETVRSDVKLELN